MSERRFVLAIDQGTTSTRAIAFDRRGARFAPQRRCRSPRSIPRPDEVEHDPEEIWQSVLTAARAVLKEVGAQSIAAIGITNQRETTLVWERATGKPLANAIVWQDRRTAQHCDELEEGGLGRACRGNDRPRHRSLFLGDQARLAACQRPRPRRRGRERARCASAPSTASSCSS